MVERSYNVGMGNAFQEVYNVTDITTVKMAEMKLTVRGTLSPCSSAAMER